MKNDVLYRDYKTDCCPLNHDRFCLSAYIASHFSLTKSVGACNIQYMPAFLLVKNALKRWVCKKYDAGMGVLDIAQELKLPVLKVMNLIRTYREVAMPRF